VATKVILLVMRLVIAGLFIYAGAIKAWDTQQFALDVRNFQLTSWDVSVVIATYLPWLEIIAGLALIAKRLYLGALAAIAGMTVVFLGAIGSAWHRGLDISCGCFGREANATNFPLHIAGNLAVLIGLAILFAAERRRTPATNALKQQPEGD
jgi:uncharacterized membrane protein YphA (DoxX/SURF4 family)